MPRREQIQLWGSVCLFIAMMVILYLMLRNDVQVLSKPTLSGSFSSVKNKFSFGRSNKNKATFSGVVSGETNDNSIELCSLKKNDFRV
ncbi:hypothetical protein ScPMuIL_015517 [Solemya velum]